MDSAVVLGLLVIAFPCVAASAALLPGAEARPFAPAPARAAAPQLTVSPEPVAAGGTLTVTGTNHCTLYSQANDGYFTVALGFGNGTPWHATGIRGGFTTSVTAPSSPGSYVLTSTCVGDSVDEGASRAVTVSTPDVARPDPVVQVTPDRVERGQAIAVSAALVPPSCLDGGMRVTWDSAELVTAWTMFAGVPGGSTSFLVPTDASGGVHAVGVRCTGAKGEVVDLPTVEVTVDVPSVSGGAGGPVVGPGGSRGKAASTSTTPPASTSTTPPGTSASATTSGTATTSRSTTSHSATYTAGATATGPPTTSPVVGTRVRVDAPPKRAAVATWLRPPTDAALIEPTHLVTSAVLAILLMLLIGFPSQLFEATYEENEERIRAFLARRMPRRSRRDRHRRHLSTPLAITGFALFGAALYGLTDSNFGRDGVQTALDAVGFLVALPLVTLAFEVPAERYARRAGRVPSRLRVVPAALVIALACALVSFVGHFQPGYVYGLIAGYAALSTTRLDRGESARAVLAGCAGLAVVAVVAWTAWAPLDAALATDASGSARRVLDAVLASVVVVAVQGLAFQLLPMKFVDGHAVTQWSRWVWRVVFTVALFALIAVTFDPRTREDTTDPQVLMMVALFAAFGMASVAFWAWFRFRPAGTPTRGGAYRA
ncbi:FGLLP motif-containing membrane protein [Intrasporangium flavum]|uniref:FGLLP motif-containing membrane protein n=1 Tax=Intrasporangium flavum TaxID=1428657 RepID=UPI00096FB6BF|nr:FGLLP motif-containing membrane protein [Intrasporangium flavum]